MSGRNFVELKKKKHPKCHEVKVGLERIGQKVVDSLNQDQTVQNVWSDLDLRCKENKHYGGSSALSVKISLLMYGWLVIPRILDDFFFFNFYVMPWGKIECN